MEQKGNVFKTAAILGISRHTFRRARDSPLEDLSLMPSCNHKNPPAL
jgi:hypothetical protein